MGFWIKIGILGVILVLIIGGGIWLFSGNGKGRVGGGIENTNNSCVSDSDCVASSCCHASSCVNLDYAPSCKGIMCSMVCSPGTLDCGQASCGCVTGKCSVVAK